MTPPDITIVEVGPRDGLQNEPRPIAAADKIRLIDLLSACGFARIEAASFVSPRWLPQMADGAEIMAGIARRPGTRYAALTPNMKGFEAARAAKADEIAIFGAASETFSRRNINASIEESLQRFQDVAEAARMHGIPMRGYVSCVTDCPYEGEIAPQAVARVAQDLFALGCYEISLGDTLGRAEPERIDAMLNAVLSVAPADRLAGHYHDTAGHALENVAVSHARGLRVFDAAIGGLGGCPYAPGAKGNLATGTLALWCAENGFETGLDMDALGAAQRFTQSLRAQFAGDADALSDDPA